jgi:hypothetical protein
LNDATKAIDMRATSARGATGLAAAKKEAHRP